LWIDDEIARDGALLRMLGEEGVRVRVAESGGEGMAMARADKHDAIIVGLKLPDMFGLTVLQRLAERTSVPVLVVSEYYLEPEVKIEAMRLGAAGFIPKRLIGAETILALLDRHDQERSHAAHATSASRLPDSSSIACACEELAHAESRHELIAIGIRALLDRRQTLPIFLAWAGAVRLALTDATAGLPVLRSKMLDLVSQATAGPLVRHPKVQQVLAEIERGGMRQQERTLAKRYRVSRWYLSRLIFLHTGRRYHDWIRAAVIRSAIQPVLETKEQFSQIAYARGYEHLSHFDHDFTVTFGCSPRRMRRAWQSPSSRQHDNPC
jgi:DNA-binding response OmpR family regulator/methylphosphotriester-DNA--protein-cysteine methyltransferase